ncbi:MAG: hypothetical protein CMB97_01365 [Flavobacteriaceae bacterium]|nr:hypothetical protein [Flavobacteriaceae bacterium]
MIQAAVDQKDYNVVSRLGPQTQAHFVDSRPKLINLRYQKVGLDFEQLKPNILLVKTMSGVGLY